MSLVLSRRPNERIMIGDDIVVTVCSCNHHSAKIAIKAPRNISVLREELYKAKKHHDELDETYEKCRREKNLF